MILSNLKVFLRYLVRHKLLALINIVGLAVGLASVLLLALYVLDELSYDRHHPDAAHKHRIETILSSGSETFEVYTAGALAAPLLEANFPEIVATTRYRLERVHLGFAGQQDGGLYEDKLAFADSNVAAFFTFAWLQGDPVTALDDPNSIVLTESLARKYFGDEDPLGKSLQIDLRFPLTVTGVLADGLGNSHIDAEAFVPMNALRTLRGEGVLNSWFDISFSSYMHLAAGSDIESLWPAMETLIVENMPPNAREIFAPARRALPDIYLDFRENPADQRTRLDDLMILLGIAIAILVVASINFVNLATARSAERQKEIAIRKVAGSGRRQIFMQHMGESLCMVLLALLLGLGLTELSVSLVNNLTDKDMSLLHNGTFWLLAAGICLLVGLLAGAYPALYLSGFQPMTILRRRQGESAGLLSFRNLLVIFQFSIAIIAIIATVVMVQQLRFVKTIELGFDMEQVLVIENSPGPQWETFKRLVLERTSIEQISAGLSRPFWSIVTAINARREGSTLEETVPQFRVDFGYFELFDVDVLAGRVFSDAYATDRISAPTDDRPHPSASIVLNAAMAQRYGWTPDAALGKRIEMQFGQTFDRSVFGEVIGVVADMHVDSVQRALVPQIYFVPAGNGSFDFQFLKLPAGNPAGVLAEIETIWRELYPDVPINHYFLDSKFQQLYQREEQRTSLVSVFAALAVFISCMGLIGLASYMTERRVKEIGVRKVVGAGVWQIIVLFSADFSRLVLISNIIAWPVAYLAMERWLENFAYRIDLTPLVFIGSGLIALCIAWVTVGGTAAKAASAKPVLALRYE